ncbi:EF-P 5-aminopentanol modification-associated protein YfmF [Lactiplantibacillus pentosus]|uniref:EF-P 5-aminopentanol modification-associated protein YfmF n=1 Tax=Lactiplantibacillus pentosus TaxID=1589 RepID=UPI001ADDA0B1|nr:pitrilysin family protein [Lactiplantibacillus pentosus]MBO9165694.1 insulinase family protein [Lactiplantibacillus pentosus]MCT3308290.1 insulinase family protein [Lactiplantibacillus pentosus]USJ85205.1 insulinase family protein [Lactiplantibacillus pentosus]
MLQTQLAKGVQLTTVVSHQFKTNQIMINFRAPLDRSTITQRALLSNLLETSSADYPDQRTLANALAAMYGAAFGAGVSRKGPTHNLQLAITVANERYLATDQPLTNQAIQFLQRVIWQPLASDHQFDQATFDRQKTNLEAAIKSVADDKQYYAAQQLNAALFANEPAQQVPSFGVIDDLAAIDARSLYRYYQQLLQDDQIDIIVTGDIDEAAVLEQWQQVGFEDRSTGRPRPFYQHHNLKDYVEVHEEQALSQAKLNLGYDFPVFYRGDHYYAALVFNELFGGSPLSKLFTNVREKASLAYYASSSLDTFRGVLKVQAGIDGKNHDQVLAIIADQLTAIQNGDFTDNLVDQLKLGLINDFESSLDSQRTVAVQTLIDDLTQQHVSDADWLHQIQSVTREQIIAVAKMATLNNGFFLSGESK